MRSSLCFLCKHKHFRKPTCTAYPAGIPPRFRFGDVPHLEPAEGDQGIQFKPAEGLLPSELRLIARVRQGYERRKREAGGGNGEETVRPAG